MRRYRTVGMIEDPKGETTELYTKYAHTPDLPFFWDLAMELGRKLKSGYRGSLILYDNDTCIQNIKIGPTK